MTYETFREKVLQGLQGRELGNVSLRLTKQMKSNGQMKYGIVFENPVTNTSPTIYLEEYYEFYQATEDLNTVIDLVAGLYQSLPAIQVDEKKLLDYSAAKSRIIMKLVNTEKNRTFLETAPHIPFQDLSIVYHYLIGKSDRMLLSMPVNDEVLKEWGVDTLELHQQALANYNRLLPIKFANLNQHLLDRGFLKSKYYAAISDNDPNKDMYFLTNEYFSCGAVLMTCKNLMDEIADFFKEDFYIIPSSIHEVILFPRSKAPSKKELDRLIQKVNQEYLDPEEYLSDHAYYYSKSGQGTGEYFMQNLLLHSPGTIS